MCVLQAPPPITPRSPFQVCMLSLTGFSLQQLPVMLIRGDWGTDDVFAMICEITPIDVYIGIGLGLWYE